MRIARGASEMSFQTRRYKRFFSCGERFNRARTLRLIQGRRKADFPVAIRMGFKRLLMPESSLPSDRTAFARFVKGNFAGGTTASSSVVFKSNAPFFMESGTCLGSNYNN